MRKPKIYFVGCLFCGALLAFAVRPGFADRLKEGLILYYRWNAPVKIHLTFNQAEYAPGDTALYKIYLFTADDFRSVPEREIVTVQLVDLYGKIIQQAKVLVKDGGGFNQISIPEAAAPGKYTVIAFHEAMKTQDRSLFFQRPLWVAGRTRLEEIAKTDIGFFPEGGHFIAGIVNKLIVTGPPDLQLRISSEGKAEVASLALDKKGFGITFIKPELNVKYFATSVDIETELPPAQLDGVGLLVNVPSNGLPIRGTIQIPDSSMYRFGKYTLALTRHATMYATVALSFAERNVLTFALPQENIPPGVARVTVFEEEAGRAIAERLIYIRDREPPSVNIRLTNRTVSARDTIPVAIEVKDGNGNGISSELAVTVFRKKWSGTSRSVVSSIVANAYLLGDVGGSSNAFIFSPHHGEDYTYIDNFLITQRWKRFSWEELWSEKRPSRKFEHLLSLRGKVVRESGESLPDSTKITFFLQKSVMTYVSDVGSSGEFDFPLLMDFYGEEEIFYVAEHGGKRLPDVKVFLSEDDAAVFSNSSALKTLPEANAYLAFDQKRDELNKSYAYHLSTSLKPEPPSLNSLIEEEIFGADVVVELNEYYLFPTMAETLREIVPTLQYRQQQHREVVRLFFDDRNKFSEGPPLYIIDGVITDNSAYFLSLNPADVVNIKIVNSERKLQAFGAVAKNGIVLIETKIPGNTALVPRTDHMVRLTGLQSLSPAHRYIAHRRQDRVPDLRSNIYWNPQFRTDASGNGLILIQASDVTGEFMIQLEGFTAKGEPVYAEEEIWVKPPM